jgi:hypothetical protein
MKNSFQEGFDRNWSENFGSDATHSILPAKPVGWENCDPSFFKMEVGESIESFIARYRKEFEIPESRVPDFVVARFLGLVLK